MPRDTMGPLAVIYSYLEEERVGHMSVSKRFLSCLRWDKHAYTLQLGMLLGTGTTHTPDLQPRRHKPRGRLHKKERKSHSTREHVAPKGVWRCRGGPMATLLCACLCREEGLGAPRFDGIRALYLGQDTLPQTLLLLFGMLTNPPKALAPAGASTGASAEAPQRLRAALPQLHALRLHLHEDMAEHGYDELIASLSALGKRAGQGQGAKGASVAILRSLCLRGSHLSEDALIPLFDLLRAGGKVGAGVGDVNLAKMGAQLAR